uniref:Uncharacterized protein n=1 Tax=Panagrellus redivivus TaxID=6233 RepID=A0A7E4UQ16_PANRE
MNSIAVIVNVIIACSIHGIKIAKEVEGGVQLLHTGKIELILPERLSFTVKKLDPSQNCKGDFMVCYEVTATQGEVDGEKEYYANYWQVCPPGTCALMIHRETVYGLTRKVNNDQIYGFFSDDGTMVCPRKLENNRATFTVRELPDCPVFVNGARLPKDEKEVTKGESTLKWIIISCTAVVLLILIVVVGFCIFMRCRNKPVAVNSDDGDRYVSKSVISPKTQNKPSLINTPVEI